MGGAGRSVGRINLELTTDASAVSEELAALFKRAANDFDDFAKSIDLSPAAEAILGALKSVNAEIRQLKAAAGGITLNESLREQLVEAEELARRLQNQLGTPNARQEEELQRALFLSATQGAHELAQAKQEAFLVAKRNIQEERRLQEALFHSATQGAHEVARAKEEAFHVAKKNLQEERQIQEAMFLRATQQAHELAVAKQEAFRVAKLNLQEERRIREALFLSAGQEAHEEALRKEEEFLRKEQEALKENLNFIQRNQVAINQLAFGVARAGGQFANFAPLIARTTTLLANMKGAAGEGAGGAAGALNGLRGIVAKGAAAVKAFASSLGIASVAAAAAVISIAALGVGIGFLAVKLGPLGGEMNRLIGLIRTGFGAAGEDVINFGREVSNTMGLSERAVVSYTGQLAQLFQAQGATANTAVALGQGLTVAADVFRRTTIGTVDLQTALDSVRTTVSGNIEGLRNLNVFITELDLRQQAAARGIDITTGALDAQTRQALSALEVLEQAQLRLERFGAAGQTLPDKLLSVKAAFDDIKVAVGQAVAPILEFAVDNLRKVVDGIQDFISVIRDSLADADAFKMVMGAILKVAILPLQAAFVAIGAVIRVVGVSLAGLVEILDAMLTPLKKVVDAIKEWVENTKVIQDLISAVQKIGQALGIWDSEAEKNTKAQKELEEATKAAAEEARRAAEAYASSEAGLRDHASELERAIEARKKLTDAYRDGRKAVEEAVEREKEAVIEGAKAVEDAERTYRRALRGRRRAFQDAATKIADVERKNARAIIDAQDDLEAAQLDQFRAVRDAEEKLRDTRIAAAKKIATAEKAVDNARKNRQEQLLDATLSIEQAIARRDILAENAARLEQTRARDSQDVKEAQLDLEEARLEQVKDIKRAERDLAETIFDQNKKVRDAEEKLRRTREDAHRDYMRALADQRRVFRDQEREVRDATRELREARLDAEAKIQEAINDRIEAEKEANKKIREAYREARKVNAEFGLLDEPIKELNAELRATERILRRIKAGLPALPNDTLPGTFGRRVGSGNSPGGFAGGGFLAANQIGLVGEDGPELTISKSNRTVVSNDQLIEVLRQLANGRGNGATQNITVNQVANDPDATAFMVAAKVLRGVNN